MLETKSKQMRSELEMYAFGRYLRTGVRLDVDSIWAELEAKFNPYHDPLNGRFTSAFRADSGVSRSQPEPSALIKPNSSPLRKRQIVLPKNSAKPNLPLRLPIRKNDGRPVPTLSSLHNEIRALGVRVPPAQRTREWTTGEFAAWQLGGSDIHSFKRQWVRGYRDAITIAANKFDLPPALLAGVAYNEVGGDPLAIDNAAYAFRDLSGSSDKDRTSFGNVSIQFRRAAQSLGYGRSDKLSGLQRAMVLASLEDPQTEIFIAAKHLSDLRNVDFRGVSGGSLNQRQVEVIATRYNRGPDLARSEIDRNLSYGQAISKRWVLLNSLIRK